MFTKFISLGFMSCLILGMLAVSPVWAAKGVNGIQKEVIERGRLRCGVGTSASQKLEQLYCKAVALAVLGDATKVDLITLTTANRFQAIRHDPAVNQDLWVDVSFRNTNTSVGRAVSRGIQISPGIGIEISSPWFTLQPPPCCGRDQPSTSL